MEQKKLTNLTLTAAIIAVLGVSAPCHGPYGSEP